MVDTPTDQDVQAAGGEDQAPPAQPTPLTAWQERFAEHIYTLRSGYTVKLRRVSFMQGILDGTLPNQVLNLVMFDAATADGDKADQVKTLFETYTMVVARSLLEPRLRLGPPGDLTNVQPNAAKGEIGPWHLTPADMYELYEQAIREVVPAGVPPFPRTAQD